MGRGIQLGRVFGIPIELSLSWFLIFGLLTWSMSSGFFPQAYPDLPLWAYWVMGLVATVLFFGS